MAAEVEEIIVTANLQPGIGVQHLLPDVCQHFFDLTLRCLISLALPDALIRRWQRAPLQLAVGTQGKGIEHHEGRRHHVDGQHPPELRPNLLDFQGAAFLQRHIGRPAQLAPSHPLVVAGQRRRSRMPGQRASWLSIPSSMRKPRISPDGGSPDPRWHHGHASGRHGRSLVEAILRVLAEWVSNEALGRRPGAIPVAPRHADAAE